MYFEKLLIIFLLISAYLMPLYILVRGTKFIDTNTKYIIISGAAISVLADGVMVVASSAIVVFAVSNMNDSLIYNLLFTALCIFIPRIFQAVYFYIRAYNYEARLKRFENDTSNIILLKKDYLNSQLLLLFTVIFLICWVILSEFNAIVAPRLAYQQYREGIGFVWAFMITFALLWYTNSLIETKKVKVINVIFLLFVAFTSGSKQILLGVIILIPLQPYLTWKIRKLLCLIATALLPIFFLFLFGQFGAERDLITRLVAYLATTQMATVVFDLYAGGDLKFYYGEIYLSGFWGYVPRAIYPDKPFEYGATFLLGVFYPGMAETGHTPSFGYGTFFADFGWFGAMLTLTSFRTFSVIYALNIITSIKPTSSKPLAVGVLFFPFYSFHVPIQITLFIHFLVSRLKLKKILLVSK